MNWQSIIATLTVLLAAAWLLRRSYRIVLRAKSGDRVVDCGHCPRSAETSKETPLIQLSAKHLSGPKGPDPDA